MLAKVQRRMLAVSCFMTLQWPPSTSTEQLNIQQSTQHSSSL